MTSFDTNLAEDYRKLGDVARAEDHLASAHEFLGMLANDPCCQMIRRGIARFATELEAAGK